MLTFVSDTRLFFYKALKEVLPLNEVVREKCFGCTVNHPSQNKHDLCLMSGYGMQLYNCYKEALLRVSRAKLMETLVDQVKHSNTEFVDVFELLFTNYDPLERIKHDGEMQLEFICFLLDKELPYHISGIDRAKLYAVCAEYDKKD